MPSVSKECGVCGEYYRQVVEGETEIICPHCRNEKAEISGVSWNLTRCPFCDCRQFYRRKDFNQAMGCFIIIVGAVLVPFTYGISLALLVFVDWLIYRNVSDLGVCYRCGSEFREFGLLPDTVSSFDHHTAELYETSGDVTS
ncbi:MAG: hypothetical protein V3U24_11095 [Candidatus Neomarinimicrobiota bacterium]